MISILIFLLAAHAGPKVDTCSDVDLRSKFGPIRDQGPWESCYAHTAADLLAASAPEPLKSPLSALHVAANFAARTPSEAAVQRKNIDVIRYYSSDSPSESERRVFNEMHGKSFEDRVNLGAQLMASPILASMDKPLCSEADLPSEPATRHKANPTTKMVDKWAAAEDEDNQDTAYAFMYSSMREAERSSLPASRDLCPTLEKTKVPALPRFTKDEFSPSVRDWAAPLIAKKMTEKCRMKTTIPAAKVRDLYVDYLDDKEMALLNTQLAKNNPVGIGYNVCAFMSPHSREERTEGCPHASSIVGRKRNKKTGACEYLVRNSFGEDCDDYKKGVKCEKGYFWASESKLRDSVQELVWIDRNPPK